MLACVYRERPCAPEHRALLYCVWRHAVSDGRDALIVPDACMDVVFDGGSLRIAGPDTRPVHEHARPARTFVGVRFRIGMGASLLDVPASALRDARVPLALLWGDAARRLEDALRDAEPARMSAILESGVCAQRARTRADPLVAALVRRLSDAGPHGRMSTLAAELGASERQLHRRCVAAVGYGPKLLSRILRLQTFRRLLPSAGHVPLAALAAQLGYADQAHLSHDCLALFGSSPARLRAQAPRTSDSDKTPGLRASQAPRHATPR